MHDATFRFLNTFYYEHTAILDGAHGSTIHIDQISTSSNLPALLQFCLSDVAVQSNKLVLGVNETDKGGKN